MPINTTGGAIPRPGERVGHTINTSAIVEENLEYADEEPEVAHLLSAAGWAATFEDGHREELLFWCVLDDATVHGVVLGEDGLVDLASVEASPGFQRYERTNNN